jgi:DHA2 family multidrug resistance protein
MSAAATSVLTAPSIAAPRRAINPWLVAVAVVVPTFMEVLDTTIANVALRYIAGGLSAAVTDSEWVITSYLAANAIILPISGWLSAHLGRRNYFLLSIAIFTIASALCGMATSLTQIIIFRIMQGLAGGGLQPSSQGVLLDAFPPEKQGTAQTLFGVAALFGPIVGPTLGGWLVVNYDWRWIFYVNVPVGLVALAVNWYLVKDPEYLLQQRTELRKQPLNFDAIGLGLLALVMACWEITLSKGQEWDWLRDPFGRVQTLVAIVAIGFGLLLFRELRIKNPIINFRVLRDRNLAACGIIIFSVYAVLYAASFSLPQLLQTLFGYDALASGLVLSPSGASTIAGMLIVGFLLGKGADARWLIPIGLVIAAIGNYWMSLMNLEIGPWQVIMPRVVLAAGLAFIFAPLNVAAFKYVSPQLRGAAVGMLALLRNEGGSVGTSLAQTIQERRAQFHVLRLNEHLDPLHPALETARQQGQQFFMRHTGDPAASQHMTLQVISNLRDQQALSLAYFDVFWFCAVVPIALIALVFIMRPSVAEKGALAGGE